MRGADLHGGAETEGWQRRLLLGTQCGGSRCRCPWVCSWLGAERSQAAQRTALPPDFLKLSALSAILNTVFWRRVYPPASTRPIARTPSFSGFAPGRNYCVRAYIRVSPRDVLIFKTCCHVGFVSKVSCAAPVVTCFKKRSSSDTRLKIKPGPATGPARPHSGEASGIFLGTAPQCQRLSCSSSLLPQQVRAVARSHARAKREPSSGQVGVNISDCLGSVSGSSCLVSCALGYEGDASIFSCDLAAWTKRDPEPLGARRKLSKRALGPAFRAPGRPGLRRLPKRA